MPRNRCCSIRHCLRHASSPASFRQASGRGEIIRYRRFSSAVPRYSRTERPAWRRYRFYRLCIFGRQVFRMHIRFFAVVIQLANCSQRFILRCAPVEPCADNGFVVAAIEANRPYAGNGCLQMRRGENTEFHNCFLLILRKH